MRIAIAEPRPVALELDSLDELDQVDLKPGNTVALRRPAAPFSIPDLEVLPLDGKTGELIDGVLYVNATPNTAHQLTAARVGAMLEDQAPSGLVVFSRDVSVRLGEDVVVPDVTVARPPDVGRQYVTNPVLVVEVLSPSTELHDRTVKRDLYAKAGAVYWVVDLAAFTLEVHDGSVTHYNHDNRQVEGSNPFPYRFDVNDVIVVDASHRDT